MVSSGKLAIQASYTILPKIIYYIQYILFNSSVPASCTVVTKSMPPYCLVAGVPAKPIKPKWSIDEILEHERALYPEDQRFSRDELESIFKDNNM